MAELTAEHERMAARDEGREAWGAWGPYLSDRQWGTVREDYSADGDAWSAFPFEQAHLRAYRWGEDGLLGICDDDCRVVFAPAFWNGRDALLKERPFGLSNPQGNHGEDVKDYYFHLDATPTASFLRGLYKYPQAAFPYDQLRTENARRGRNEPEFELAETGIFDEGRYFDIVIEYAKAGPHDVCMRIRACNRGPEPAPLTVLPTVWFRNTWSWGEAGATKPRLHMAGPGTIALHPWERPRVLFQFEPVERVLFTDNETNAPALHGSPQSPRFAKDAFHRAVVQGETGAVNPDMQGTKAAPLYHAQVEPGGWFEVKCRLCVDPVDDALGAAHDGVFAAREAESAAFYESLAPGLPPERAAVHRRAYAGLFWSRKFYLYPVARWLDGDPGTPQPKERLAGRNAAWREMHAHDLISMPDGWEYPYFCAWDLLFHAVALASVDPATAKRQSMILRGERYTAPSAQMPAYEWALSDTNPPIGAWSVWRVYSIDRRRHGAPDVAFLKRAFNKLLMHYAWWANRVDQNGDNVFAGGFLGLDNIGIFDRRAPLPDGSRIEQSDGTAWMAMFCLNMLNISIELAKAEPAYEDIADKFLNDFIYLAAAINSRGASGFSLWDEEDGFYYDVLRRPDGSSEFLRTRSVAGLTPLFAVESFDERTVLQFPLLRRRVEWFARHSPQHLDHLHHLAIETDGRRLLSLVPPYRLRRLCARLFDENEFLSPHGVRSLSRTYLEHPCTFRNGGQTETLAYCPGESPVAMFGGNSNWRGPVWMPMNFLVIEALQKFGFYFGDSFQIEFPTGSGRLMNLWDASLELERRLVALFLEGPDGRRPFQGAEGRLADDPNWRDHIAFHEYFHGDTGAGLGASHQTGWTALVAKMIEQLHTFDGDM